MFLLHPIYAEQFFVGVPKCFMVEHPKSLLTCRVKDSYMKVAKLISNAVLWFGGQEAEKRSLDEKF